MGLGWLGIDLDQPQVKATVGSMGFITGAYQGVGSVVVPFHMVVAFIIIRIVGGTVEGNRLPFEVVFKHIINHLACVHLCDLLCSRLCHLFVHLSGDHH